jgi:hypothetical protein
MSSGASHLSLFWRLSAVPLWILGALAQVLVSFPEQQFFFAFESFQ